MKPVCSTKKSLVAFWVFLATSFFFSSAVAQEYAVPLPNINGSAKINRQTAQKPTALSLPFFDDFTNNSFTPNPALWQDDEVYISNTMSSNQFSRGIAVFDANNQQTIPYDTINPFHLVRADSLTSQNIDLSTYNPSDSLWLSFYYEPGGSGFLPKPQDSLMLFFKKSNGQWQKIWATAGDTALQFKEVLVPVLDTAFFNDQFAFRFVNKATHGIGNSNWNLDYVYLTAHRNFQDTTINDLAFTQNSSNLLNDFTAMPYNQFKVNPSSFLADSLHCFIKNNGLLSPTVTVHEESREILTGTAFSGNTTSISLMPEEQKDVSLPAFSFSSFNPPSSSENKAVFETKYYVQSVYPNESKTNDTIIQQQVFDNYFAYDDGSAEEAYFLNLFPNAPGITAVEYALYRPDTLRGVAIYFPRTVPSSRNKEFSLIVYKSIAINGSTDQIIHEQDFYLPKFQDTINQFHIYRFEQPVPMDTGIYYIGVMQAAGGFSDSLYIGLDVNRKGGNHRYFNVDGIWHPSEIPGAVMVRPIIGAPLPPTTISPMQPSSALRNWWIYPNPAHHELHFKTALSSNQNYSFKVVDLLGRIMRHGYITSGETINLRGLTQGVYFFTIADGMGVCGQKKFVVK